MKLFLALLFCDRVNDALLLGPLSPRQKAWLTKHFDRLNVLVKLQAIPLAFVGDPNVFEDHAGVLTVEAWLQSALDEVKALSQELQAPSGKRQGLSALFSKDVETQAQAVERQDKQQQELIRLESQLLQALKDYQTLEILT